MKHTLLILGILATLPLAAQEDVSENAANNRPQNAERVQNGGRAHNGERVQVGDRRVQRERLVRKFDENKDGKLDEQEKARMDQFIEQRKKNAAERRPDAQQGQRPAHGPNREEIRKRFDKDQDGKLDDEERAEMEKAMENRRQRAQQGRGARPARRHAPQD